MHNTYAYFLRTLVDRGCCWSITVAKQSSPTTTALEYSTRVLGVVIQYGYSSMHTRVLCMHTREYELVVEQYQADNTRPNPINT